MSEVPEGFTPYQFLCTAPLPVYSRRILFRTREEATAQALQIADMFVAPVEVLNLTDMSDAWEVQPEPV